MVIFSDNTQVVSMVNKGISCNVETLFPILLHVISVPLEEKTFFHPPRE